MQFGPREEGNISKSLIRTAAQVWLIRLRGVLYCRHVCLSMLYLTTVGANGPVVYIDVHHCFFFEFQMYI